MARAQPSLGGGVSVRVKGQSSTLHPLSRLVYVALGIMSFGLMSPSALCRIWVNVVRLNVAFGVMSFGLMLFGLISHSAICRSAYCRSA